MTKDEGNAAEGRFSTAWQDLIRFFPCLSLIIETIIFARSEENQYSLRIDSDQIIPDSFAGAG